MNKQTNKVTSVFTHGSAKRLYFEFFDNTGKKKQKSTGLENTPANRRKAERELIPLFEKRLEEESKKAKDDLEKKKDHSLKHYAQKHIASQIASKHTKAKTNANRILRLLGYFGEDIRPRDITELNIEEFFEQLDVSRDTKSDWKVLLTSIFEKARKDQAIPVNIVKQFTLPNNVTQNTPEVVRMPYSSEEVHRLLSNADRRLRNYLGIAFHLGLRPEEILGLMEKDIHFGKKTIYLTRAVVKGEVKTITQKKGGERDVPLYSDSLPFIEDQIAWARERNSPYLFFDENGKRLNDSEDIRGIKGKGFYWNDYLASLNITPIRRMMNTRHTFAVHCIRNMDRLGITLNDIASMMGHSSLRMLILHYGKYLTDKNKTINRDVSIFGEKNTSTEHSTESIENAVF